MVVPAAAAAASSIAPMAGSALINEALIAYGYVASWIGLSSGVILFNKYILSFFRVPVPDFFNHDTHVFLLVYGVFNHSSV